MQRMKSVLLVASLLLVATAAGAAASVQVKDAWIREAPAKVGALGAFATIENHTDKARILVAAHSAAAEKVQLHKSVMEDGMAKMIAQEAIEVPAKGDVKLQPGGLHIMLINPKQAFKAGDKVEVTLEFKDGAKLPVNFEVRRAEGMPMDHNHMGHDMGGMHH